MEIKMTLCSKCEMDEEGRRDYFTLRMRFFSDAFVYCRQIGRLWRRGKTEIMHSQSEYAAAYEETNYTPEFYAIEELMVEVIYLTLDAGRGGAALFDPHKRKILRILSENDLHKMLLILPDEERLEFVGDFNALGIIEEII